MHFHSTREEYESQSAEETDWMLAMLRVKNEAEEAVNKRNQKR